MPITCNLNKIGRIYQAPGAPHRADWTAETLRSACRLPEAALAAALAEMQIRVEIRRAANRPNSARTVWIRGYVEIQGSLPRRKAQDGVVPAGVRSRRYHLLNMAVGVATVRASQLPASVPLVAAATRRAQMLTAALMDMDAFAAELNKPLDC